MSRETAAERLELESRRVERVYAALARIYDGIFDWALGPGRRRAIDRLPILPGDRVLEVGVGTGLSFPHYPAGARLVGIDISGPMLEQARERAEESGLDEVSLALMDAHELEFADGSFDCVLAPYVIFVVPEADRVMREIRRVCKVGGTVVVVNHFGSDNRLMRWIERSLSPLTRWVGFRLDLPLSEVRETAGLRLLREERVNLFGLWRLMELRRES
jgi:phosphatidylethanolamine/phosphatidyl-N-methylethanolamine N-methyltransferase